MSRFGLLFERLLHRRLLGDGDGAVSIIPASFFALSLSSFIFTLVAQERSPLELALFLCLICFIWSGLRTFLEARNQSGVELDRSVLEPLPIPKMLLTTARLAVLAVMLAVGGLNLSLPPVMIVAGSQGIEAGLLLLASAFASTLSGLAIGTALRRGMELLIGSQRLQEWEGPLRLFVAVALFGVVFAAPDPTGPLRSYPIVSWFPPFSFALFAVDNNPERIVALVVSLFVAVGLLFASSELAGRISRSGRRGSGAHKTKNSPWSRLMARWFVRDVELAAYDFALANLARDRSFRARVYPLFAFPFAVIVLVASNPDQIHLPLMALFGVPVYLVLAQTFQEFTESERGPALLAAQPILDQAAFRLGAEKAFLVALLTPIFSALVLALVLLSLFVRGAHHPENYGYAVHALLFSILLSCVTFEKQEGYAFAKVDRGIYPADLSGGTFGALMLSALAAVLSAQTVGRPIAFLGMVVGLVLGIKFLFANKRRRWLRATVDPV